MILLVLPCLVHKFFNFPGKHIMIQPHSIWLHLENNKRKPQPNYWDSSSASGKFALMYSCGPFALSHVDLNWVTDKTCTGTSIENKCWANAWLSLSQTSGQRSDRSFGPRTSKEFTCKKEQIHKKLLPLSSWQSVKTWSLRPKGFRWAFRPSADMFHWFTIHNVEVPTCGIHKLAPKLQASLLMVC